MTFHVGDLLKLAQSASGVRRTRIGTSSEKSGSANCSNTFEKSAKTVHAGPAACREADALGKRAEVVFKVRNENDGRSAVCALE